MNIFDQYGIKEIANVCLYAIELDENDNEIYVPVLYLDTLKVSTVEQSASTVYAQGGIGNTKLVGWDYGKDIKVHLEDALFTPAQQSMMWTGKLGAKKPKLYLRNFTDELKDFTDEEIQQKSEEFNDDEKMLEYMNNKNVGAVLTIEKFSDFFIIPKTQVFGNTNEGQLYCWLVSGNIFSMDNKTMIKIKDLILIYDANAQKWFFFGENNNRLKMNYQFGKENFNLLKSYFSNNLAEKKDYIFIGESATEGNAEIVSKFSEKNITMTLGENMSDKEWKNSFCIFLLNLLTDQRSISSSESSGSAALSILGLLYSYAIEEANPDSQDVTNNSLHFLYLYTTFQDNTIKYEINERNAYYYIKFFFNKNDWTWLKIAEKNFDDNKNKSVIEQVHLDDLTYGEVKDYMLKNYLFKDNIANFRVTPENFIDETQKLFELTQTLYIDGYIKDGCKYYDTISNMSEYDRNKLFERTEEGYQTQYARFSGSIDVQSNSNVAPPSDVLFGIKHGYEDVKTLDRIERCVAKRQFCFDTDINLLHAEYRYLPEYAQSNLTVFIDPKTMCPYQPNTDEYETESGEMLYGKLRMIRRYETYYRWTRTTAEDNFSVGKQLTIDSQHFPGVYRLVGETVIRDRKDGIDYKAQFEIPRCKLDPNTTIQLEAEGEPTVFDMDLEALRMEDNTMMKLTYYTTKKNKCLDSSEILPYMNKNDNMENVDWEFRDRADIFGMEGSGLDMAEMMSIENSGIAKVGQEEEKEDGQVNVTLQSKFDKRYLVRKDNDINEYAAKFFYKNIDNPVSRYLNPDEFDSGYISDIKFIDDGEG